MEKTTNNQNSSNFTIKCSVIQHVQKLNPLNFKPKTYYTIEVKVLEILQNEIKEKYNNRYDKTYEEFENLYTILKKHFPKSVPKFPTKGLLSAKTTDNLNKRRDNLDTFIKECLIQSEIKSNFEFANFLGIGKVDIQDCNKISKLDSFSNNWAIRNFLLMPGNERLLISSCETKQINKIDAYLNNLENGGNTVYNSSVKIVKITKSGFVKDRSDFKFTDSLTSIHALSCYDPKKIKNLISIGFSSGNIYILEDSEEFESLRLVTKFKCHKGKVFSVFMLDEKTVMTLGIDTIKIWEVESLLLKNKLKTSSEITSCYFNQEKIRVTIGLKNGYLEVYTVSSHQFVLCEKIRNTLKEPIKVICYNYSNNTLFTSTDKGNIIQFQIIDTIEGFNLIEKKAFKTEYQITALAYNPYSEEIIVGDSKGILAFYSIKGELNFSKRLNLDKIRKIVTIGNLLIVGSNDKVIGIYKISGISSEFKEEIKNNSYGGLILNDYTKKLDKQFENLLSEPVMKNLKEKEQETKTVNSSSSEGNDISDDAIQEEEEVKNNILVNLNSEQSKADSTKNTVEEFDFTKINKANKLNNINDIFDF